MKNQIFSYYKTNFNSTMHKYNYIVFPFLDEWDEFNFGWSTLWAFADGSGIQPESWSNTFPKYPALPPQRYY